MPIHVTCACGCQLTADRDDAGRVIQCPKCGCSLAVPDSSGEMPGPPAMDPLASSDPMPVIQTTSAPSRSAASAMDRNVVGVYLLAISMVAIGLLSVVPVLMTIASLHREQLLVQLPPWAYAIVFSAMLHLVYGVYVAQLPDRGSVRVVSVLMLLHATGYAMLMGIRLLASPGNLVIRRIGLDASDFTPGQQAGWCLLMVLLYGTASYAAGHLAGRWQHRSSKLPADKRRT